MRKALNFDLDTKKYEEFTGKHSPLAYAEIRNFLKRNDFDDIYKDFQISGKIKGLIDFLENDALEQYKYHNFKNKEKI